MSYNFNSDTPIYLQIIELIKSKIIIKDYLPGQKLPSVRDYSILLSVNPNTIQKSLAELENMKLIITERTNGKFVTSDEKIIDELRRSSIKQIVEDFYNSMQKNGFSLSDIIKILEEMNKEL